MLIDEATIHVESGKGGDGLMSFRREKYVPLGGPHGGDGGRGGHIILKANPNINTLYVFKRQQHFKAKPGGGGGSSNKTGANAPDLEIEVPAGTIVRDAGTDEIIADLVRQDDQVIVAHGGRGGRGNARFATPSNRAPRMAEKGAPGQQRTLKLELKLIADIGIVGVPNAGKSTLLSVISNAKPKIADYPFTTLEPNLGTVFYSHRDLVFADIPGLIEGAHMGVGLGHSFLRHVQRTRLLVHVLDGDGEDPIADYNQINAELALFDEGLPQKPQIVVFNKMDLPDVQAYWELLQPEFEKHHIEALPISAATHQNIDMLIQKVFALEAELPDEEVQFVVSDTTYTMPEDVSVFEIVHNSDGSFQVTGQRIERAAAMTYWDYQEAVNRFQKILETLGVNQALHEAGVQPGDTVFIGDHELEWTD